MTPGQILFNSAILFLNNFLSVNVNQYRNAHPHEGLPITALVPKHGYPLEEHEIQTEDGYLLTLFRIPRPSQKRISASGFGNRPPVLLVHGILSSAQDYVLLGPENSLAYSLVDNGYDVWLGNCRGNRWSRKHVKHHPDDPIFWQFSFHELGYYDLPAMIDYVTNATNTPKIFYVAHSQGTTSMFVLASERPEYNRKIKLFVALAPVAYTKAMPSIASQIVAAFYKQFEWVVESLQLVELFPHSELLTQTLRLFCVDNPNYKYLCDLIIDATLGYSLDMDRNLLPLIVGSFPAGCASRQGLHFIQNKLSDKFNKYDYGPTKNLEIYGQRQPPKYNMRTSLPTAIIYSNNDWLSTEVDVDRISSKLKNLRYKFKLPGSFNHADYLFGREAPKIIHRKILQWFSEY